MQIRLWPLLDEDRELIEFCIDTNIGIEFIKEMGEEGFTLNVSESEFMLLKLKFSLEYTGKWWIVD